MTPWDERYAGGEWIFGTEPNDFLREQAHRIPEGRVLCLGEGEGRNSVFLAEMGFEVVGVDESQVGLDKAQALARQRGVFVETVVSSIQDFDLRAGEWQGIVSIFFHLPPTLRRRVHEAVVRGLAPGGVLILEAYTPRQLKLGTGGPKSADRLMTLSLLEEELEGLQAVVAREVERDVQEGRMHRGVGSVVQFVGLRPPQPAPSFRPAKEEQGQIVVRENGTHGRVSFWNLRKGIPEDSPGSSPECRTRNP